MIQGGNVPLWFTDAILDIFVEDMMNLRAFALYSMVDGSRQSFLCLVGGKNKERKKPWEISLLENFHYKNTTDWVKNNDPVFLACQRGKTQLSVCFFFLVRDNFSSTEDSLTIEYNVNALNYNYIFSKDNMQRVVYLKNSSVSFFFLVGDNFSSPETCWP